MLLGLGCNSGKQSYRKAILKLLNPLVSNLHYS
jgi:hypothetical protein